MRIKTIEQTIALKQLKGTPRSMAVQLHPVRQRNFFEYVHREKEFVTSNVHGYAVIKHKSSCIVV